MPQHEDRDDRKPVKYAAAMALCAAGGSMLIDAIRHGLHADDPDWGRHAALFLTFAATAFFSTLVVMYRETLMRADLVKKLDHRYSVERRLRLRTTALEAAANAVVITDALGTILWVNPAFTQLTGYAAEEAIGNTPRVLKSGVHDRSFYEQLWSTVTTGAVWHGELTNRRKDGSLYVEEMTITPVRAAGGEITHYIAIKVDVSWRRQTEDALARSEKTLRSLVDDSPYSLFRSTADGRLLGVNPAMVKLLGYDSEAELMEVPLARIYQNPEERVRLTRLMQESGRLPSTEVVWLRKDTSPITVILSASTFPEADGSVTYEAFAQDITQSRYDERELRRLNRLLSTLGECNRALVHARDEAELLKHVCSIIVEIGGYNMAWAGYAHEDADKTIQPIARAGPHEHYLETAHLTWADTEWGQGPSSTAIRTGAPCVCNHALSSPRFSAWRERALSEGFAAVLSLPLKQNGRVFGVLAIYSDNSEAFDRSETDFLVQMADDLAYGVLSLRSEAERRRAEEALREAEEKYRAIFQGALIGIFQTSDSRRPMSVNPALARMHGYDSPEHFVAEVKNAQELFVTPEQFEKVEEAVRNGVAVSGVETEVRRRDGSKFWAAFSVHAVRDRDGKIVCHEGTVEDITSRKAAEEEVLFLAYYDPLTRLPNRRLQRDRLNRALASAKRHQEKVAVLFLDLDGFKIINDSLGHSFGDKLLQQVAARLQACCREQDTVARVGGDEFLIVVPGVKDSAEIGSLASRVLQGLAEEFVIQERTLNVGCSMGISIYPDHGHDSETLIKNADAAMYTAKQDGRKSFRVFSQEMNTEVVERLTFENDLRRALEEEKLFVVYQPQVNVVTETLVGVEALLRWQHPRHGLVPTEKVIRVAESSGLIHPIGEWVLRTACLQARRWQQQGLGNFPVAVNVSAMQFYGDDFPEVVRNVLKETGLAPDCLELELTETILMSNPKHMFAVLQQLRESGVRLAIDDFGSGYSSFSYLRRFSVDKLKIDRSFVQDVAVNSQAAAITTAIINMARSLHVRVIAEGVEDEAQLSFLRTHECDEAQGYYLGRPVRAEDLTRRLEGVRDGSFSIDTFGEAVARSLPV